MNDLERIMGKYKRDITLIQTLMKKRKANTLHGVGVSLNSKRLNIFTDMGVIRIGMVLFTKNFREKVIEGIFKNPEKL